ncbi:AAA family ATPase [Acidovorax sp. RAC01]|mgnify:CR=1 FL=1|uniref:AAA family ATPase n=1 Tax=Acidovorax sp. RAC01 TaxID=1842533 RepID=UPI000857B0F5|nr:ATP-binding protein [Acidovorax sp. RAC01]AOG23968.1 zeta toxin family protein [Acidovorax sp. RAC01]
MLILFCGWAGAGKTTLARIVSNQLRMHYIDMDDLRQVSTGRPKPRPTTPDELEEEAVAMLANYGFMKNIVEWHLENSRPLVISGTFSKPAYWDLFLPLFGRHISTRVRVVRCLPVNDDALAVSEILQTREREGYNSSVNTVERYEEVKARFKEPPLEHLTVRTWGSLESAGECARKVLDYVVESGRPSVLPASE